MATRASVTMAIRAGAVLLCLAWSCAALAQRLDEKVLKIPVKVTDAFGKVIEHDITVTVWEDASRKRYPLLILNHGRSGTAKGRADVARARYSEASRWLAQQGWSVWVPTRIGYGVTGGPDPEDTGNCDKKNYPPGYAVSAEQTRQVIEYARKRPDIDGTKIVVAGQSYGGTTAITVAAMNLPGVVAGINFAGGGGGRPDTHPGEPCLPAQLEKMFGDYGKTARIPTIWVYAENDQYFKPKYTKAWFDAYQAQGGKGEFVMFPPHGEDGHGLFTRGFPHWKPVIDKFLASLR
jgi:dienelactone hydrolase